MTRARTPILVRLLSFLIVFTVPFVGMVAARADLIGTGGTGGGPPVVTGPPVSTGPIISQPTPPSPFDPSILNGGCGSTASSVTQCPVPQPTYRLITMPCGHAVSGYWQASLVAPIGTSRVTQDSKHNLGQQLTPFADGDRSQAACRASFVAPFKTATDQFGLYLLTVQGDQQTCSWKQWSDGHTDFAGCGAPFALGKANTYKLTVWCGGTATGWDPRHSFTLDECATAGEWQCVVDAPTWTMPGSTPATSRTFDMLYRGTDKSRITSPAPRVTGLTGVTGWHSRLAYLGGPRGQGGEQFLTTSPGLDVWQTGITGSWGIAQWHQTRADFPHSLDIQYQATGTLTYSAQQVVGVDLRNRSLVLAPVTATVTSQFTCHSGFTLGATYQRTTN